VAGQGETSPWLPVPRLVGDATGGKDLRISHQSADTAGLTTALVRARSSTQGQKWLGASRANRAAYGTEGDDS